MLVNLLKINLLFVIAALLAIHIWQINSVEEKVLNLEAQVAETGGAIEVELAEASRKLATLDDELADVEGAVERLRRQGFVAAGPGAPPPAEDTAATTDDPRELPYWKTDDNILVDLDNEPRPPPGAKRGGIIRYFIRSNPRSLNAQVWSDAELQEQIVAPVVEYPANQSRTNPDLWVPGICNRITVSDDYKVFTLYVRKGMYWHEPYLTRADKRGKLAWLGKLGPQEITAEDVKFIFDVVRDPLSECGPTASYLTDLDRVELVDRYTLRVTWKKSSYFNKSSTLGLVRVYPRFIYTRKEDGSPISPEQVAPTYPKHWFNNRLLGSGPFMFAGFEPNQRVRLRRAPNYWSPVKPVIDGMDLLIAADNTLRLNRFKAGELDMIFLTPAQYRAEVLEGGKGSLKERIDQGQYYVKKWKMFTFYFVAWNLRHKILRDREVRRALAHLYPKETIIRDIHYGLADAHDSPVHVFENFYADDLEQFPYDPEKAGELLDAAGWKLGPQGVREKVVDGETIPLRFKLLYATTSSVSGDMALLFEKAAKQAGVLVEPDAQQWEALTQILDDKGFDSVTFGWGNDWDGDPSQIWHPDSAKSAKGSNYGSYINPRIAELIEGLKLEFDLEKRKELWRDFQHTIAGDQPYLFDTITTRVYVINSRLQHPFFCKIRPQIWFLPWVDTGK